MRGIQTDNGSEFTGLLANYNPPVKRYGLTHSPLSQGSVEMTNNRLVVRLLSKYKRQHVVGTFNSAAPERAQEARRDL